MVTQPGFGSLFHDFFPASMDSLTIYFGGLSHRRFFIFAQQPRHLLICWGLLVEQYFGKCLPEKLYKLARGIKRPETTFNSIIRI